MSIVSLNKPTVGSTGWGANVNQNFTDIEDAFKGTQVGEALAIDNLKLDGNTLSSTDTNGNINLTPNGTGKVVLDGLNWPTSDGTNGQVVQTNGSGTLSFADASGGDSSRVETLSPSAASDASFTSSNFSDSHLTWEIRFWLTSSSDNDTLQMEIYTGGSWQVGASDYEWSIYTARTVFGNLRHTSSTADSDMQLTEDNHDNERIGNDAGEGVSGWVRFFKPASSTLYPMFRYETTYVGAADQVVHCYGCSRYLTTAAVDNVRFKMKTGNLTGSLELWKV